MASHVLILLYIANEDVFTVKTEEMTESLRFSCFFVWASGKAKCHVKWKYICISRDWNLHVVGVRWTLDVGWSMQVSILMLVSVLNRYWSDYWEVKNIANWIVKNSLWHTALPYVTCLYRIKVSVSVLVSAVLDLYLLGIRLLVEHIALHLDFPLWVMYMS